MKSPRRAQLVTGLIALLALLASCGGNGADSAPSATPEPTTAVCASAPDGEQPTGNTIMVAGGTIAGRADPSFLSIEWPLAWGIKRLLIYGPDLAAASVITGFVHASFAEACNGAATTYNGYDEGGTYAGGDRVSDRSGSVYLRTVIDPVTQSLSGSIRYTELRPAEIYGLSGGPIPGAAYDFNQPARVADIQGSWTMKEYLRGNVTFTVDAAGGVQGSSAGCAMSGSLTPLASGKNLFALQLNGGQGCRFWYGEGFALAYPMTAGGWQMVVYADLPDGVFPGGPIDYMLAIGRR